MADRAQLARQELARRELARRQQPQQEPNILERYQGAQADGEQRIQEQLKTRPDILSETVKGMGAQAEEFSQKPLGQRMESLINPAEIAKGVGTSAMNALGLVGGISQRGIAMKANAERAVNQGDPLGVPAAMARGFTGEELGEFGDSTRAAGFGETTSGAFGLVTEGLVDPTTKVLKAGGVLGNAIMHSPLATKGKTGAIKRVIHFLQDQDPNTVLYNLKRGFKNFTEKNLEPGAMDKPALALHNLIEEDWRKPASALWTAIEKKAPHIELNPGYIDSIVARLQNFADNALGTDQDLGKVYAAIKKLSPPKEALDDLMDEGLDLVDVLGRKIGGAGKKAKEHVVRLTDLMNVHRTLRDAATNSVVDQKAAAIIGKALEGIPRIKNEARQANALWHNYSIAKDATRSAVGTLDKKGAKTRGLTPQPKGDAKAVQYFKSEEGPTRKGIERLKELYANTGRSSSELNAITTEIQDIAGAKAFGKRTPNLKSMTILGSLGIGSLSTYDILTGKGDLNDVGGVGLGIAGIALGTPRYSAKINKLLLMTPKDKAILAASKSGGEKVIRGTMGAAAKEAIARELVGRNRVIQEDDEEE